MVLIGNRNSRLLGLLVVTILCSLFGSTGNCARTVTLLWDANSETNIAGYRAHYGLSSRSYPNVVNAGNSTNVPISGLIEGVTYYFAVTAYDTAGMESDYSEEVSYTVPSTVPNRAPTLGALASITIVEDAGPQIINLTGISSGAANETQTLVLGATSTNPELIPNPFINYTSPNATGTLTFTPAPGASGNATINVTVNDGQAISNTTTRAFTVTVNAVNDPPTLNPIGNVAVNEGLWQTINLEGISSGALNENQTLRVSAVSSNPTLVPHPSVNYTSPNSTGSLIVTPNTGLGGSVTITVTVNDGQGSGLTISRTFSVTVNRLPLISAFTNRIVPVNTSTGPIPFTISDSETPAANLSLSASSSNTAVLPNANIVFSGSGGNRTVTMTPATGLVGVADVTITVSDGAASRSSTFRLTIQPKPSPPSSLKLVAF